MRLFSLFGFCVQANTFQRYDRIATTAKIETETNATIILSSTKETTTTVTETTTVSSGTCKIPEPTLWGNPATDCLGFGEECKIDEIYADQERMIQTNFLKIILAQNKLKKN